MSIPTKRVLYRFLIFGLMGLLFEVLSGAVIKAWHGNWNMHGSSSPWMIFDYGLVGLVLMPIAEPLKRRRIPLVVRALVYMVLIYAVEFVSGWLFDVVGLRIWSYHSFTYNLRGYITAEYAWVWYGLGLVLEFAYRRVDAVALTLAAGFRASDIERFVAQEAKGA